MSEANGATRSANGSPPRNQISNTGSFKIVESILLANPALDTETKIRIAKALDDFGVDYIALPSPVVSTQAFDDCKAIASLGLRAKLVTQVPCTLEDATKAIETGVDGLDVVISASQQPGKDSTKKAAVEVIEFVKSKGKEVRFSPEDSFGSDPIDLLGLYKAVDKAGVDRVGIADATTCANPRQVYDLVRRLRGEISCDIECNFRNDTICATANAFSALEVGATHVRTAVLGIGPSSGIVPLGDFMARTITAAREYVTGKYKLRQLKELEDLVADASEINVPFNNPVTGFCAFSHKAGIHTKAILNNPSTYEIINPEDFGVSRHVQFASKLTGWNAIKSRAEQLGLKMTDDQYKTITAKIKAESDKRNLAQDEADSIIRAHYEEFQQSQPATSATPAA